jgi:hypothetical protein
MLRSPGLVVLPVQQNLPLLITQRLHIHTGGISYLAVTERALAHGTSRWARVVNTFTFDLTTRLRYEFCCRAGPSIGDWPGGLSTGRCDLRPSQPKFGGGVRRATAHSDRRSKGPRLGEAAIGREQKGLDNDNRRNTRGGFEQDC